MFHFFYVSFLLCIDVLISSLALNCKRLRNVRGRPLSQSNSRGSQADSNCKAVMLNTSTVSSVS